MLMLVKAVRLVRCYAMAAEDAGMLLGSEFTAYNEGLGACLRGERREACPYPDKTTRNALWRLGWERGVIITQR